MNIIRIKPRFSIKDLAKLATRAFSVSLLVLTSVGTVSCKSAKPFREVKVSVRDQKMALFENGRPVRVYPVSTSKFGIGDQPSSNRTPIGKMRVAEKIGQGQPLGMVFKSRRPTGEIVRPNSPGRDPIVSRILWLQGLESKNSRAYGRFIYIHGTPEEQFIGRPASYGCIRMRSRDVADLFNRVPVGTLVSVEKNSLPRSAGRVPQYIPPPRPIRPRPDYPPQPPRLNYPNPGGSPNSHRIVANKMGPEIPMDTRVVVQKSR